MALTHPLPSQPPTPHQPTGALAAQADSLLDPSQDHATMEQQTQPNFGRLAEREDVVWAYRLLLGREPESAEVVESRIKPGYTLRELQNDFFGCLEFVQQHMSLGHQLLANVYAGNPKHVMMELDAGLRLWFDLSDYWIGSGILNNHFEMHERSFVRGLLRPGQTVLDIGANIGVYAITMAALVGPTGRVYAFEPVQSNVQLLQRSIQENKFQDWVQVEQVALGSETGSVEMMIAQVTTNSGGAFMMPVGSQPVPGHMFERVPVRPLSSYTFAAPIDFIKMDIEGAEPLVIRSGHELLLHDQPTILSELHPVQLQRVAQVTPEQWIAEMAALGYGCYTLHEGELADNITTYNGNDLISVVFVPDGRLI